jgi:hypothetical protein
VTKDGKKDIYKGNNIKEEKGIKEKVRERKKGKFLELRKI